MRAILVSIGLIAAMAAATACGDPAADDSADAGGVGGAGGGGAGGGGKSLECNVPDTSCPADMPFPGALCSGSLQCAYSDNVVGWDFSCVDGQWDGAADCSNILGGCPIAPEAEGCQGASTAVLPGISVAVGPAEVGSFVPFEDGLESEIVWGAQGSAMVFFRLKLDGEDIPNCVMVTTTLSAADVEPSVSTVPATLRCGETLRMYAVVPYADCTGTEFIDTTLHIDIEGIGETEVVLKLPDDAFCGGFG